MATQYEITNSSFSSVDIKITPDSSYARYRVIIVNETTGDKEKDITFDISSTATKTIEDLNACTFYRINVGYTNNTGAEPPVSGYVGISYFWTAGVIGSLSSTETTIKMPFEPGTGATGYYAYFRKTNETSSQTKKVDLGETSYTFTGLSPSTSYTVNYQPFNDSGTGKLAVAKSISTLAQPTGGSAYVYYGGWKKLVPYIYYGGWKRMTAYIYYGGWKPATG